MDDAKRDDRPDDLHESLFDGFLDNRGLEPPMPMVRTLEAYERLDRGQVLRIHNDRVPVYLLPQLHDRGATYFVREQPDGSAIVDIEKPGG